MHYFEACVILRLIEQEASVEAKKSCQNTNSEEELVWKYNLSKRYACKKKWQFCTIWTETLMLYGDFCFSYLKHCANVGQGYITMEDVQ